MTTPLTITWQINGEDRSIQFDAVLSEEHSGGATVTEHPVEKGAAITDHVRPEQERVTIEALVTNTPTRLPATQNKGARDRTTPQVVQTTRRIRGIPVPVAAAASVLEFDAEMDRPVDVWAELRDVRDNARLIKIEGGIREYTDMIVDGLTVPRAAGNKRDVLKFSISAKKLRIVESREVSSTSNTSGTKKRSDKGHQGTKPASEKTSTLWNLVH
jgi:hypothetical protein